MKSLIALFALFVILMAFSAYKVASNNATCQEKIMDAATAFYFGPTADKDRSDAIALASSSYECTANQNFAKFVQGITK